MFIFFYKAGSLRTLPHPISKPDLKRLIDIAKIHLFWIRTTKIFIIIQTFSIRSICELLSAIIVALYCDSIWC